MRMNEIDIGSRKSITSFLDTDTQKHLVNNTHNLFPHITVIVQVNTELHTTQTQHTNTRTTHSLTTTHLIDKQYNVTN